METPSRHSFNCNGSTRVFPIASPIKGDNYCRVEVDGVIANDRALYDIVNNSIVFVTTDLVPDGAVLDVLVVQSEEAIGQLTAVNNIDIVAQDIANVNLVGNDIANVDTVAGSIANVATVAGDTIAINEIYTNRVEIYAADENAALATTKASEAAASALTVADKLHNVASVSALLLNDPLVTPHINLQAYHSGLEGGGGTFYWDAAKDKALHNGGTVIDPAIVFPTDWNNQTQLAVWFTAGTGSGCWVRQFEGAVLGTWFGAKINGITDDTKSWISVNASMPLNGGKIKVPTGLGLSKLTSHVVFTKPITLEGESSTSNTLTVGTGFVMSGAGELTIAGESSGARDIVITGEVGNTGNGINLTGSRPWSQNLSVFGQGQDGVVVGSDIVEANVNSFNMINLKTKTNGRHGLYIVSAIGEIKNANAGTVTGLDSAGNKGNGLQLQNASNNTFIGIHCETNNGVASDGINCIDSDGNVFLQPYCENNTLQQVRFDVNSDENKVWGMRNLTSVASITDLGAFNIVLGQERAKGIFNFFNSELLFKETGVSNPAISGWWKFSQNAASRALDFVFKGTSTSPIVFKLSHENSGKIEFQTDYLQVGGSGTILKRNISQVRTIDFPSIPANSSVEIPFTLAGSLLGDIANAAPAALEAGLVWSCYVIADNSVRIRVANVTAAAIDPISRAWRVEVRGY